MNRLVLLAFILALLGANVYVYHAIFGSASVRVTPLAAGEGGATLVTLPKGHAILINAGADASTVRALGEALPAWQRHVDALILLGDDKSAVGGAPFIEERYTVVETQKIPAASAGIVLHYESLSLALSSTTPGGTYPVK